MYRLIAAGAALALTAAPAFAQDVPTPEELAADRNSLTVALGGAVLPDYEGSDDYRVIPALALRGKVDGFSFFSRGTFLYVDLVRDAGSGVDFDFGPIAGVRLNRTGKVKDDIVDRLPDRDTAIELGGFAGVTFKGVTNPYDQLSLRVDVVQDVAGAHGGGIVTPTIDFGTPLSRTFYVGASLSADFVSDEYADEYFGVTAAEALASGLPAYDPDSKFKDWKIGLLANQSLSGDLTRGFALFGTASFSRLQGDFKDSPLVRLRGSASQWLGALGVAYTF